MSQDNEKKLKMTFTPNTIEHLGVRMYSTLPPVIAELIANSQDADASQVHISLNDKESKEIIVADNGHGMSFSEINEKFLRIGRNRRNDENSQFSPGGRKIIGKKGLGKLSFFGIAHEIEIATTKDYIENSFVMRWGEILSDENKEVQKDYSPTILKYNVKSELEKGTVVVLRDIQRVTDFNQDFLADNISRYFIIDPDFNIYIKHNDDEEILINNERKYSKLAKEIEWNIPEIISADDNYDRSSEIKGYLMSTEKPIPPITNMKGITLFSRKKLVNLPEYFSDSTSSHFFTYLTGWLEVDYIDDLGEDVIGTNRQSLNWEHPEMLKLREYLQRMLRRLEIDWRAKRSEIKRKKLDIELKKTGITIKEWQDHVPNDLNSKLTPILESILKKSEFSNDEITGLVKNLKDILPPYPYYHYQKLHPVLSSAVFYYYSKEDYYNAVVQGVIKYIREMQKKSGIKLTDIKLIKCVFSPDQPPKPATWVSPKLSVTKKFKRPDGSDFEIFTQRNITSGHGLLAEAMWSAFRCPIGHELATDLRDSGLYTEQDCLDALGLLSHLFRRLDNSEIS